MKEIIRLPQPQRAEVKFINKSLELYAKITSLIHGNREIDVFNNLKFQIQSLKKQGTISYNLEKKGSFEVALKKEVEHIRININSSKLGLIVKNNLNIMLDIVEGDALKMFKRNKLALRKIDKITA